MKNSNNPAVSIIVACYNAEQYLPLCLKSLTEQSLENIEIICIDDASLDKTREIIEKAAKKDSRIVLLQNKSNMGVSKSRNAGIDIARADYIMFCDADDYYDSRMCEEMYEVVEKSHADMAISEIRVIYEAHKELMYSDSNYYSLKYSGLTRIKDSVVLNTDLSPTNKIFKKEVINKNNIRFPEGLYYEDAYFCVAYFCCSKNIYFLNDRLYNYIRHKSSTMSDTFSTNTEKDPAIDHLHIAFKLFDFLKEKDLLDKYNNLFWQLFYSFELFALNNSKTRKRIKQIESEALEFINKNESSFLMNETSLQENILSINTSGLRINKLKAKKALIRIMPMYRLQVANIERLRSIVNKTNQMSSGLNRK